MTDEQDWREDAERTYGPRLLAYVDLLGWSEIIRNKQREELLEKITEATLQMERARSLEAERRDTWEKMQFPAAKTVRISHFSDTIVFSCKAVPTEVSWLVDEVRILCSRLLGNGIYTRGALTVGDLTHYQSGTIYGRALIDAHEIERDVAKYPRLIVTDDARALMVDQSERVIQDFDGLWYLSVFPTFLGRHVLSPHDRELAAAEKVVATDLAATEDRDRYPNRVAAMKYRAKYVWLRRYFALLRERTAQVDAEEQA